ncbi:MAG: hypothetical protein WCS59_07160 [Sphaerochaetaceae bacterium]|jgi:hypothetical protein|nr:hypothetical protein [Sphaerochaetaceae bacterium]
MTYETSISKNATISQSTQHKNLSPNLNITNFLVSMNESLIKIIVTSVSGPKGSNIRTDLIPSDWLERIKNHSPWIVPTKVIMTCLEDLGEERLFEQSFSWKLFENQAEIEARLGPEILNTIQSIVKEESNVNVNDPKVEKLANNLAGIKI